LRDMPQEGLLGNVKEVLLVFKSVPVRDVMWWRGASCWVGG
jgi:hypothetical protein